jgi:hypothetical protein
MLVEERHHRAVRDERRDAVGLVGSELKRPDPEKDDLASRANSTSDKGRLLAMAEAWLDLADRAHRLARHHVGRLKEHPLLSSKLGNEPQEAE